MDDFKGCNPDQFQIAVAGHPDGVVQTALGIAAEILDRAGKNICVGDQHVLTIERINFCGPNFNTGDRPGVISHFDHIPEVKGLLEQQ